LPELVRHSSIRDYFLANSISLQALQAASTINGGFKMSGLGRELGSYALNKYTEVKSVFMGFQGDMKQ